jgi:hypothetical protein
VKTFENPAYITGLLEAAGSFNFNRGRNQWNVVFAVTVGGENRELLENLRDYFGGGRIYPPTGGITQSERHDTSPGVVNEGDTQHIAADNASGDRETDSRHSDAESMRETRCSYRVTRPADLLRIVDHFERHPFLGARKKEFAIWREMVALRAASIGQAQPAEMEQLAKRLSEQRISRSRASI